MNISVSKSKLATTLAWAVILIFLLMPLHAVFTTWLGATIGHFDLFRIWKELLLVPMAFVALLLAARDKRLKEWLFSSPLVLLILLYILLHIILGVYALSAGNVNASALIYALLINLRFFVFFLVVLIIAKQLPWLSKNWHKYVLCPAIIVVVFGLLQLFILPKNVLSHVGYGPHTIPAYQTVDQKPSYARLQSTLRGPNPLGAYLVLIITVIVGIALKSKKQKWLWVLGLGSLIVLVFTYSRAAWLGLILSLVLLIYWSVKSGKLKRQISILLVGILILGSGLVLIWRHNSLLDNTLFHTDKSSHSAESSNAVRTEAMLHGAKSVLHQPIGYGPGSAGPASVRNNHPPRIADNYFIQIGQEVGILGLGLFIAINFLVAKSLWAIRFELLPKILLASLIGLTLVNMLSHAWADDTLAYLWWGLAGLALAPSVILNKERKKQHV